MSDFLLETPVVPAETWCPECSGPPISERAALEYCRDHMPATRGESDNHSNFGTVASWLADAGGEGNRNMCDMIHRKETPNV